MIVRLLCALSLTGIASPASALSSDWVDGQSSRIRLVAEDTALGADGEIVLGLEITMEPGWKTYWRTPGEAGIPPFFDWSKSANLKNIDISWPVPHRVEYYGIDAFTYSDRVVLPVKITAFSPSEGVDLKLTIAYGVCSDLCILEQVDIDLPVPSGVAQASPHAGLIASASAHLPLASLEGLELKNAVVRRDGDKTDVEITVTGWTGPGGEEMAPDGAYDVFLEAGPEYLFGRARYQPGPGNETGRFLIPMVAGPDTSLQDVVLLVTAVSPNGAVEVPLIISEQ